MSSRNAFSNNYLELRPEKAGPIKLGRFLWSRYIEEGKDAMILCQPEENDNLKHKGVIFLTLLVQMILLWIATPLKIFGLVFEWFLNLPSSSRELADLDLSTGQLERHREAASFVSAVGHTDPRVKLDSSINRDDERYNRALSAMASKISYENKAFVKTTVQDHWKMELVEFYNSWNVFQRKYTTQSFILHDKSTDPDEPLIVVAFRGTELFDADAWSTDLDISWYEYDRMGKVHGGFMKALGLTQKGWPKELEDEDSEHPVAYYTIRNQLRELVRHDNNTKFIVTGHSLGGALAILFAAILALHEEELLLDRLEGVYTFGQPRVGDEGFKKFMEEQMEQYNIKYERIVYSNDLVPRIPFDNSAFLCKHFGTCLYYNSLYKKMILEEEPNKNYFDPMELLSTHLVAVWELIRSFIIPYVKGRDYEESCLLKMIRVVGLVVPGAVAHNPHDYVNSTRLAC